MSQFTTNFKGELIGKNKWKNLEKFEYHIGEYPSKEVIVVPADFETDFASVPRMFWGFISPVDTHAKAAVIHDYCYYNLYNRKKSDKVFLEGLKVLNVPRWKVFCMYRAVRTFGWIVWWRYKIKRKK